MMLAAWPNRHSYWVRWNETKTKRVKWKSNWTNYSFLWRPWRPSYDSNSKARVVGQKVTVGGLKKQPEGGPLSTHLALGIGSPLGLKKGRRQHWIPWRICSRQLRRAPETGKLALKHESQTCRHIFYRGPAKRCILYVTFIFELWMKHY